MPNSLSFDVQFTKAQMLNLVNMEGTAYISVSGTYTYRPDLGTNVWELTAKGHSCDATKAIQGAGEDPCIKPC